MENNVFTFGDTYWHQLSGTAMGTPPAPTYATLFYSIHEETFLDNHPSLFYYKRYIDDVFGIWVPQLDPESNAAAWAEFSEGLDYLGLRWEVSNCKPTVDFMDLTISIHNQRLTTTLFEKVLNLYLYIPPQPLGTPTWCSHWIGTWQHTSHLHVML